MTSPQHSVGNSLVPQLRIALADPDPRSRRQLRELLEAQPGMAVLGGCGSGAGILELIARDHPDVIFSEVTLPDMDGFELARRLDGELSGGLIFVSRFSRHALQAFEVHALDFLIKPVNAQRLTAAVSHIRSLLDRRHESGSERLLALLDHRDAERQRRSRMLIRGQAGAFFLKTSSIDWLEATGKHVRVHAGKRVFEQRDALARLEAQLDADQFVRVSRSALVNLDRIREIQPWFNGEYLVLLEGGPQVPSSRRYRSNVRRLLGKKTAE
jgi:two-component system, LytTR family, response regulator